MARHKDAIWTLPDRVESWEQVNAAILMDLRAELKKLNALLHCHNFIRIPSILDQIAENTRKPKRGRPPKARA